MSKSVIPCPKCNTPLSFRRWSKRNGEALAFCDVCREKWQVRMWHGKQTSEPYQVREPAKYTESVSAKTTAARKAAIIAMYGSVSNFWNNAPLISVPLGNTKQLIH